MTDEQILGPPGGATPDDLAAHYPVQLGTYTAEEAAEWGAFYDPAASRSLEGACWIDLKCRRMVHGSKCACNRPQ